MSSVTLAGSTIHYDDAGSGDPIVLVHGHPFNRSMWAGQVVAWRDRYRVVAPDLRGYGATSVTPDAVTLTAHAYDLLRLIDHLGLERVTLGGLSMGGQIVMEFYTQFPSRVSGLILAATFAQLDSESRRQARLDTADRLEREGMDGYAAETLPKMLAPASIRDQPAIADRVLTMMRTTNPTGAAASLRGRAARRDYLPLLPRVMAPALVIVGTEDAFTPLTDAYLMHEALPNARLAVIEGAGHMPNLERPDQFNALVTEWISDQRVPARRGRSACER